MGFRFDRGDVVFHKGSWDPVTILEREMVYDSISGNGEPGYRVTMKGWFSGPQLQVQRQFVTYEENLQYMEIQLYDQREKVQREEGKVRVLEEDIERLKRNRPEQKVVPSR